MRKEAEMTKNDLDDLFAAMRQQPATVSDGLMARVLEDAATNQPALAVMAKPKRSQGFLAGLLAAIGGAGGLAGLSTAAIAGVWFGFAQPAALTTVTDSIWGSEASTISTDSVNIMPGLDDYLIEG
jgi:hypothetical protein